MSCVFCSNAEIAQRAIARSDLAWAVPTNIPIVPGHTLILPTRCVATFEELTTNEREVVFSLFSRIKKALAVAVGATGFNIAWNEGAVAGQSVPHFHLHVVPRYEGDTGITEYEPRTFLYRPGSREATPEAELRDMATRIAQALG